MALNSYFALEDQLENFKELMIDSDLSNPQYFACTLEKNLIFEKSPFPDEKTQKPKNFERSIFNSSFFRQGKAF